MPARSARRESRAVRRPRVRSFQAPDAGASNVRRALGHHDTPLPGRSVVRAGGERNVIDVGDDRGSVDDHANADGAVIGTKWALDLEVRCLDVGAVRLGLKRGEDAVRPPIEDDAFAY